MAAKTSIIWKLLYWAVVTCSIFLLLASFFQGVSGSTTDYPNTDLTTGPNSGPVTVASNASISTSGPKDRPDPTTTTTSSRDVPETATASTPKGSGITGEVNAAGMNATMTTAAPISKGTSPAVIAAVIIILLLAVVTIVLVVWFCKCRNQPCCKGHRVRARHGSNHESFTSDGGINGFGMSPVQAEMQPFIMRHRCDIFIHHHGTDLTLAEMMRSKLLDQESHLHVTLWSEIAGTGRDSRPSTKRLALSLVHSTTIVLLVSWKYLQHESQRFRLALSRIPRKVDSVRGKVVIVRRIEEDKVPQDLMMDIAHSLEYNVDTDSKFFWPRFDRAVIPQRDDMLYWRS
ncbi:uncharacterized protein LOC100892843 [Strongylocentrotus purpuratus]|uniref:TIR domain-containing protein n=1 Tax=Strongylocentrotus purpuratus TaxID=7668 RepID=A0A7M7NKV3_STRPU|nr:uncharacterized protein LOC100892843 [Strongylocentrotus purpuratus]|eukprot:XP_003725715.1 PREDICTED: uncharacterized protein LOC100892843 [Strongylocentrotus purpuratus]